MKLDRKLELALQSVRSIATHDDAPTQEVELVLDVLAASIKVEKDKIRPRKKETRLDKMKLVLRTAMDVFK